jgi:hypothetical protein
MSEDITWRHHRARVGSLSRDRAADDPELVEARRDLAAIVLENRVRKVLAADPPLTAAQRSRIADLLLKPPVTTGKATI